MNQKTMTEAHNLSTSQASQVVNTPENGVDENVQLTVNLQKFLEAGVHFGHRVTKWNPRMAPFIYGERNGIHILDLIQTMQFLGETSEFLEKFKNEPSSRTFPKSKQPFSGRKKISDRSAGQDGEEILKGAEGGKSSSASRLRKKDVLFVGTKKQASSLIEKAASKINGFETSSSSSQSGLSVNSFDSSTFGVSHRFSGEESKNSKIAAHYVNHRWLGGLLTNWSTMKICIQQLNDLEKRNQAGEFENLPKKERAALKKDYEKLMKFFGGIQNLKEIPDLVFILGQDSEMNAVRECLKIQKMNTFARKERNTAASKGRAKLSSPQNPSSPKQGNSGGQQTFPSVSGLRTITLLDTNCDPELADLFIPANDDSAKSLTLFLDEFTKILSE